MRFAFSLSSLKVNVLGPADSAIREPNCSAAMRTSDPASTCMTDLLRVRARADAAIGPRSYVSFRREPQPAQAAPRQCRNRPYCRLQKP
jgi:hypothetical protein